MHSIALHLGDTNVPVPAATDLIDRIEPMVDRYYYTTTEGNHPIVSVGQAELVYHISTSHK